MDEFKLFIIVIERMPGDRRTEEWFDYHCRDEQEARAYARSVARLCGPNAAVKSVRLHKEEK